MSKFTLEISPNIYTIIHMNDIYVRVYVNTCVYEFCSPLKSNSGFAADYEYTIFLWDF